MTMFAVAYVVVWLAVVLYIARLAGSQRGLMVKIEALRSRLETSNQKKEPRSKAA